MFDKAPLRLALFFAIVVAVILVLIGLAVLSAARASLFDGVNDDLEARAQQRLRPLAESLRAGNQPDARLFQGLTAGGYFYAFVRQDGTVVRMSANVDEEGPPDREDIGDAMLGGPTFVDTKSSDGEDLRVYLRPIPGPQNRPLVMEVGRSTEPERQALRGGGPHRRRYRGPHPVGRWWMLSVLFDRQVRCSPYESSYGDGRRLGGRATDTAFA